MASVKRGLEGVTPGNTVIYGGFLTNGSSAPATTYGKGFTVAHASTGVWTVTLTEPSSSIVSVHLTLNMPTGELPAHFLQVGDKTATTFDIEHLAAAATQTAHPVAADITAATDQAIYFICVVSDSGQPGSA